jgi:hypothetical protein
MECTSYGDILEQLAARPSGRGWDACCPLASRHNNQDRNPSLRLWVGERGELVARCLGCGATWGDIVRAIGTTPREWWPGPIDPERKRRWTMSKVTAVYDYRDASGNLYAQKIRKEPGPNGEGKTFSWRRPLPPWAREQVGLKEGDPAWVWGLEEGHYAPHEGNRLDWRLVRVAELPGVAVAIERLSPGLYRLPDLLAAPSDDPVAVVEGEGKADLLASIGVCAVSTPSGAKCWNYVWAEYLAGRKVLVIPDNNPAGLAHAAVVAGSALLYGAAAVKVIVPGPLWAVAHDQDIGDWLKAFPIKLRRSRFGALVAAFPKYEAIAARQPVGAA